MLWPFGRRNTSPLPRPTTIETLYGMIVAQARLPEFYAKLGVPDTVNGRFDMVLLHLWMILRRLRAAGAPDEAQALFDHFCGDMDGNLREMGIGDLSVPKQMVRIGEAFYGRTAAYDAGLEKGEGELSAALARNVLLSTDAHAGAPLAHYVMQTLAGLESVGPADLLTGAFGFPQPATGEDHANQ